MNDISNYVEQLLTNIGLTGTWVPLVRHAVLVLAAAFLAAVAGWACHKLIVPVILGVTRRTAAKWDDVLINERVLLAACQIVPAIVVWMLLPWVFYEYPTVKSVVGTLTAIYITVMTVRMLLVFLDSVKDLNSGYGSSRNQYVLTFVGVARVVLIFLGVIVVLAFLMGRDPMAIIAGLGATSAILMLVFQDTIKGIVAGIRLTSNDMLHKGDWIAVTKAGANGIVEDISLTTVKIRNFDNTVTTVTPQALVDDSFHNWTAMQQSPGRRVSRKVYFDFRTISPVDSQLRKQLADRGFFAPEDMEPDAVNLSLFRRYAENYIRSRDEVNTDLTIVVKQLEATQAGLPLEFCFFVRNVETVSYEHTLADIMEHIYAIAPLFGLSVYQLNGKLVNED